jgi:hypothetical protein
MREASAVERERLGPRPAVKHWHFARVIARRPLFWKVVADEWCGFDRIDHSSFAILFKRFRPYWQPSGDPFFIAYRASGQIELVKPGLSWTLDRRVAAGSAIGHRWIHNRPTEVVTATLSRTVALVSTERKESELMLFELPGLDEV